MCLLDAVFQQCFKQEKALSHVLCVWGGFVMLSHQLMCQMLQIIREAAQQYHCTFQEEKVTKDSKSRVPSTVATEILPGL